MTQIDGLLEQDTEPVLHNDYPVYAGYAYVADGEVVESPAAGTVADLKEHLGVTEVRKCDLAKRDLYDTYNFKITDKPSAWEAFLRWMGYR